MTLFGKGKSESSAAALSPAHGMPHPFLPGLKSGTEGRFPLPTRIGVWEERPQTHLGILGESLEIPSTEHRIHSIPDPWARVLLFDRALYDEDHLLHKTVLAEWKAVLALLGLRERRSFDGLIAREVNLNAQTAQPGTFSRVLVQLLPSENNLISADTTWERIYILEWRKQPYEQNRARPFGMTSPSTLVCTGADYGSVLSEGEIPWFKDGRLIDPTPYLNARERRALAGWLLFLARQVVDAGRRSSRSNSAVALLKAFATDLDRTAVESSDVGASIGMTSGLYRFLDHPSKPETESVTDVEIVCKEGAPRYLLIDPSLATQWNQSPTDITVYADITLATANRLATPGATSGRTNDDKFHWCTPQYLFADRLIYEPSPEPSFPGCVPVSVKSSGTTQRRNVVFPHNPEVLKLFTPEYLAENVRIEWLPGGGASCRFMLTLKSGSKTRVCEVQRTYSEAELVVVSTLPMVCIWPDFRLKNVEWKTYYTFQLWQGEKDELAARPWTGSSTEPMHRKEELDGKNRFQVYITESYPQALVCENPYFDGAAQREKFATGILLLQVPQPQQPGLPSSAIVGIDFGSTGSNVYMRRQGGEPKPITFLSRIRQITEFDVGKFADLCRDLFVPNKDWPAESILSLFHDFGDPARGDSRLVLRDGHVLYSDDPRKLISGDRSRVLSNLKWGTERERIAAQDFLMQLCLQAAAEMAAQALNDVKVRFSYPTAFSATDLGIFQGHWEFVTKRVREVTGVNFNLDAGMYNREGSGMDNREAVVATRFFSDETGNGERLDITGGALTLDIGGGTTDFAVWRKGGLESHSSVILAGRDIFLAPIRRKPEIVNEILGPMASQTGLDKLLAGERDTAFNAQLDAIVAKYGDKMIEQLPVRQARESVQGFLSILEAGLCGLMFYAGMLVRSLAEADKFKPPRRLPIFVGGNGSKIFRWCSLGVDLQRSEIHKTAAQAFSAGTNFTDVKVEVHLSAKPKSEVAYGLVCDAFPLEADAQSATKMAGEKFKVGEELQEWNKSPSAADIQQRNVSVDETFPMFTSFLNSIGRSVDEDTLDRIRGAVNTRLSRQAQEIMEAQRPGKKAKPDDVLRNEPIFILALKRYLELETDAWARQ